MRQRYYVVEVRFQQSLVKTGTHYCMVSPTMIRNLTAHGTRKFGRVLSAERIELDETLETLGIDMHQFVDLGIMIGTDFHPGFRGVGPKTGLKLIRNFPDSRKKLRNTRKLKFPRTST